MKKRYAWILALFALACGSAAAAQQSYPNRTVRVVVFLPAGGAGDVTARIVAQKLGDAFGQNFVVDNRPGMGGVIGTSIVAKAAPDLAGGHVQFMFDAIAGHLGGVQSGRVKAFAVTGPARVAAFPDTPTMAEVGLPRVTGSVWYGLMAPAGTPKPIIAKLNAEANRILAMQEVKDRMAATGMQPAGSTPEEFGKFIRDELAKWGPIVKAAGVKVE